MVDSINVCGRDRHYILSHNRAAGLKLLLGVLALVTLLASSVAAKYVETRVLLPDSLGPQDWPQALLYDSLNQTAYLGGLVRPPKSWSRCGILGYTFGPKTTRMGVRARSVLMGSGVD